MEDRGSANNNKRFSILDSQSSTKNLSAFSRKEEKYAKSNHE